MAPKKTYYLMGHEPGAAFTGLLDTYTGASLAFSLRYLSSAFHGSSLPVVEGQRISDSTTKDFTPSELTDGTLVTFAAGGDVGLSTWYDQSGSGFDLNIATGNQPQLVKSGVVQTINGLPSALYEGGGDFVQQAGAPTQTGAGARLDHLVAHADTTGESPIIAYGAIAVGGLTEIALDNVNVRIRVNGGTYITTGGNVFAPGDGKLNLVHYSVPSGASTFSDAFFHVNNTLNNVSLGVAMNTGTTLPFTLARRATSTPYLTGYISEYIHWPSDQSANRAGIASNTNTYYTIY